MSGLRLSKEVSRNMGMKDEVLKYFNRKGYSVSEVAVYGTMSGIPLAVIHFFMYTYGGIEEGLLHSRRLCEYYSVEFDV
jgi:hypothetical protein